MQTDTLIIGAGPGGLACARLLAEQGREVLVVDRNRVIGPKVCAGGITWSGLLQVVDRDLIEREFASQYIRTNLQQTVVREKNPIVATIGRQALGQWMARQAEQAGARLLTGVRARSITGNRVILDEGDGRCLTIHYRNLVGADGSCSLVRRHLGLPVEHCGIGINVQVPGRAERMEWHLNSRFFGSGYGWIFPHRDTVSIGAYCDRSAMGAATLKKNLLAWARQQGHDLGGKKTSAALICCDYRGFHFGSIFLVGDAAGLASGLTGEGIYPAIVSGRAVARKILDPGYPALEIETMVRKQRMHHRVVRLAESNRIVCALLMEWLILLLRMKILDFHALEMAD